MNELVAALFGAAVLFSARSAKAAEFPAAKKGLPSLVMLSTLTCPACVRMSKVMDSMSEKYAGKMAAEKINISEKRELAYEFKVQYIPHLLFIDAQGQIVRQETGYLDEEEVIKIFEGVGIKI